MLHQQSVELALGWDFSQSSGCSYLPSSLLQHFDVMTQTILRLRIVNQISNEIYIVHTLFAVLLSMLVLNLCEVSLYLCE